MSLMRNCKSCKNDFILMIDENICCFDCFLKKINYKGEKPSKIRRIKKATYIILFTLPIYLLIWQIFGATSELIYILGFTFGQCFDIFIDWCMRKF